MTKFARAALSRSCRILLIGTAAAWLPTAMAVPIDVTTGSDGLHYTGACTLRDAIENVTSRNQSGSTACPGGTGNDTIRFASNISTVALDPALGEIEIGEDVQLTLAGRDAVPVVLDGQNATRIFRITGSKTVVMMHGLAFRNGAELEAGRGGAVYVEGARRVEIWDSRFEHNTADFGGGALAIDGNDTTVKISDVVFSENSATGNANGDEGFGGAVDILGSAQFYIFIANTRFVNNQARSGGALHCASGSESGALSIVGGFNMKEKGSFENNTAWAPNADKYGSSGGGAIMNSCPMSVRYILFHENLAAGKGGAIYQQSGGSLARIYASAFQGNAFVTDSSSIEGNHIGGAIATEGGIDVDRSSFTDNRAKRGAAVHVRDTQVNHVRISSSTLLANSATETGGALYVQGSVNAAIWNDTIAFNTGEAMLHVETPNGLIDWKNNLLVSKGATLNCSGDLHVVEGGPTNMQQSSIGADTCLFADPVPFGVVDLEPRDTAPFYPFTTFAHPGVDSEAPDGDPNVCAELQSDQLGQPRNADICTAGAVEP